MSGALRQVGVVLRRSKVDHAWIDHVWSPEAILPDVPATQAGAELGVSGGSQLFYAGAATLELHSSETGNYRDNLVEDQPRVWVALRRRQSAHDMEIVDMEIVRVTADPTEGETLLEAGSDVVASVPMPPAIAAWIAAFVDKFHVERVFHKRQRDKSGPDPRKNPGARMRGARDDGP